MICDKPLTNTLQDAVELEALVDRTRLTFAVSYVMSCFPMIRQAREIIQDGTLGKINQIHVEFLQDWMVPKESKSAHVKWRLDPRSLVRQAVLEILVRTLFIWRNLFLV